MEEKDDGKVRDLTGKLQKGEITRKEAYKILREMGLTEKESFSTGFKVFEIIVWIAYFVLWLLPAQSIASNLDLLGVFARLQSISFPTVIIYSSIVIVGLGTILFAWQAYSHRTRGGLGNDEPIIFYRVGAYHIIRHPGGLGFMMLFLPLPFILSPYIPFTILTVFAIVLIIVYLYIGVFGEEKLSIDKWGDEYRQYMKEVPRFNFILGIWRYIRRNKSK